jgi:hypothetical protein
MANYNLEEYVTVAERVDKFYERYPKGSIQTEIVKEENEYITIKAFAYKDNEDQHPSTGHAREKQGAGFVNSLSHVENCETSAVGRALANLAIESKKHIRSKDEMENKEYQMAQEKKIDKKLADSMRESIKNHNIDTEFFKQQLALKGYSKIEEIKMNDYSHFIKVIDDASR